MKIRIKGSSIRYRVTRSEVANLARVGYLEERTGFGNSELKFVLEACNDAQMHARFNNACVTLYVPKHKITEWANSDLVGLEEHMPIADKSDLYLLVEKDFKCIDRQLEDQSDYYENPVTC